ncbi:MAG: transcriptional regulator GutM [Anaerolineales bacterium]|nr:transcriptional regulator GutM [Anaerolineales bacterium]
MELTGTTIVLLLAFMWAFQYGLSFWQMRRYYKRLAELRREGLVWVGLAGSAWRRRQYAVLVVTPEQRIVRAEQLSGWTVLATLKPLPGLEGRPVSDLLDDTVTLPVTKKQLAALRDAVKHMQAYAARKAAEAADAAQTESGALPASTPAA